MKVAATLPLVLIAFGISPAFGQSFQVKLNPSTKNPAACVNLDNDLAVNFAVTISGDSASVTGKNVTTPYKKIRDGVYQGSFLSLTGTVVAADRSLRVEQRNTGCAWEGKAG